MSAYIVNVETIAKIVCGVDFASRKMDTNFLGVRIPRPAALGKRNDRTQQLTMVGLRLWSMNTAAVNQRYNADHTAPHDFKFVPAKKEPDWQQVWRLCDEFDYQCLEGDIPDSAHYRDWLEIRVLIASLAILKRQPSHVQDY